MPTQKREERYKNHAYENQRNADKFKKKLLINSLFRLLLFLSIAILSYMVLVKSTIFAVPLSVSIVCFFLLLRRHSALLRRKERADISLKIARDELDAFQYNFSAFNGITEKTNPAHDFSFDLDVFGNNSLTQIINRTALHIGTQRLADMLENPLNNKEDILARQCAVEELSKAEKFCLNFRITGILSGNTISNITEVKNKFSQKDIFKNSWFWKILAVSIPSIYVFYAAFSMMGLLPTYWLGALYTTTLILSFIPMKKISSIWIAFDKNAKMLSAYSFLFKQIEDTQFRSELLQNLQRQVVAEKSASSRIKQLAGYIQNLNSAFAFPVLLILNPFLLWNVSYALKIERWLKTNGNNTQNWFSVLAEFDALISLGTFTANHPHFSFPKISDTSCFYGKELGHPLIPDEKCIKNDISISKNPYFMIVTGANMAGKSTYLRTIGVNHLLASIGAPVCAKELTFYPGRLLTNLRTSDSLVNNESYFFAELKRLKMIMDILQSGEDGLFIILDEILKGTNSEDKQKGSFALMKRLIQLNGNGIIATHDLELSKLEVEFPEAVENFHFDAEISNDTLLFSYKLQNGIAKNMNASFLMKKMGIV